MFLLSFSDDLKDIPAYDFEFILDNSNTIMQKRSGEQLGLSGVL